MGAKTPRDQLGNELHEGDFVTLATGQPLVFKVVAAQDGGLHTNSGQTPALVRIVSDMTIQTTPGGRIAALLRIVNPESEAIIKGALEASPKPKLVI